MRPEVEIIATLASQLLPSGPVDFSRLRDHQSIRAAIADVVPGYAAVGAIDRTRREFQIAGRTLHTPHFNTPSGKAHAVVTPLPDLSVAPGEFRLMTLRSEGQFNTVVYEEEDLYRGNSRRDVVMMNAADAARLGLREGRAVRVTSAAGGMQVVVAFADLPPGNLAMYYPEANVLVPRRVDPASGTPAFKSVAVRIEAGPPSPGTPRSGPT
jgi:anaerobic selenocysteine-containing dehydrogenase